VLRSVARRRLVETENPSARAAVDCKLCKSAIANILIIIKRDCKRSATKSNHSNQNPLFSLRVPSYTWQYFPFHHNRHHHTFILLNHYNHHLLLNWKSWQSGNHICFKENVEIVSFSIEHSAVTPSVVPHVTKFSYALDPLLGQWYVIVN
jgi:hypothetical protein